MNDLKEMERILYNGLSNTKLSDIIMQLIIKLIISNAFSDDKATLCKIYFVCGFISVFC